MSAICGTQRVRNCWGPPPSPTKLRAAGSRSISRTRSTVTAGTTYVASYFAPQAKYSVNENYFNSAYTNGPLTALATGTSGRQWRLPLHRHERFSELDLRRLELLGRRRVPDGAGQPAPGGEPRSGTDQRRHGLDSCPTDLTANDTDPENDPLTITGVGGATNGSRRAQRRATSSSRRPRTTTAPPRSPIRSRTARAAPQPALSTSPSIR